MYIQINNVITHPQVQGFGQSTSTLFLSVDIGEMIIEGETRKFLLSLIIIVTGYTYYFSNVYSPTDVVGGILNIGEVTVIGEVDPNNPDWVVRAQITYLNATA